MRPLIAVFAMLLLIPLIIAAPAVSAESGVIMIDEWKVVGPFLSGSREGFVHHLADWEGNLPEKYTYREKYPSTLADGGWVKWQTVKSSRNDDGELTGRAEINLEGVDWESREAEWGPAGLLNAAYAHGAFRVEESGLYVIDAQRGSPSINGVGYLSDPYGHGISKAVFRAKKGLNEVVVGSSGYAGERWFSFKLIPLADDAPAVVAIEKDVLMPDLVDGLTGAAYFGVPILNQTEDWLKNVRVTVRSKGFQGSYHLPFGIAPLASMKVPVKVKLPGEGYAANHEGKVPVEIVVDPGNGRAPATFRVYAETRKADEPHVLTFLSKMDNSAQKYGVNPPLNFDPDREYALIMSTHGAGVDAGGQVRAYSRQDWRYVVAPTNRRKFGFDWQDFGRIDFEEVYKEALMRFNIDEDKVVIAGHSMGGHGAWLMGAHHADWFKSCVPAAGWIGFDTYVPMTMRYSHLLGDPEILGYYMRGLAPSRVSNFVENFTNLPVRIFHGGADDNVPPTHARYLNRALEKMDYDVEYYEFPDAGHWWDFDKERDGADAVDSVTAEQAFRDTPVRRRWPKSVRFYTSDPGIDSSMYWVEILRQKRVMAETIIRADVEEFGSGISVETKNITAFALTLSPELIPGLYAEVTVDDQAPLRLPVGEGARYVFGRSGGQWSAFESPDAGRVRSTDYPGSFRKAFFEPFLLVVPTEGSAERNERLLNMARSMAGAWWRRGNGMAPIVRDFMVTDEMRAGYNLVLLGGPDINGETSLYEDDLNICVNAKEMRFTGRNAPGEDLASAHWQKNMLYPRRKIFVYQATSAEGDKLLGSLVPFYSGHGLPDYVVLGPESRARSWGGFKACGFWSFDFRYDKSNGWTSF